MVGIKPPYLIFQNFCYVEVSRLVLKTRHPLQKPAEISVAQIKIYLNIPTFVVLSLLLYVMYSMSSRIWELKVVLLQLLFPVLHKYYYFMKARLTFIEANFISRECFSTRRGQLIFLIYMNEYRD